MKQPAFAGRGKLAGSVASLFLAGIFSPIAAAGDTGSASWLSVNVGQTGVFSGDDGFDRFGVDYRFRAFGDWQLSPAVGVAYGDDDSAYVYAEMRRDFGLIDRWTVTPSLGLAAYDGEELDLGSSLHFRTGIELAYHAAAGYRLGLGLFHMSNAGLADDNPGAESLLLSIGMPIDSW